MKAVVVAAAALIVASCAAPDVSREQRVGVFAVPSGAICEISREGAIIAQGIEVPEIVTVGEGSPQIEVTCVREGYAETTVLASIDQEPVIIADIVPDEFVEIGADEASRGTLSFVYVELVPELVPFQGVFDGQPSTPFD